MFGLNLLLPAELPQVDPHSPTDQAITSRRRTPAHHPSALGPSEDGSETTVHFQDPVIYDDPAASPNQQAGGIAIKWDSERKRRQGYYAQIGEGSEKSNFRHYSKSQIDFGK